MHGHPIRREHDRWGDGYAAVFEADPGDGDGVELDVVVVGVG